jgi:hypothetical protein
LTAELRYTRQVRLAEVGEEGQARLAQALVRVSLGGLAGAVEARYLHGAGVVHARVSPGGVALEVPAWLSALHPAARDVATGAHEALSVMRAVLSSAPHPRVGAES